jgi:hypothetical protein
MVEKQFAARKVDANAMSIMANGIGQAAEVEYKRYGTELDGWLHPSETKSGTVCKVNKYINIVVDDTSIPFIGRAVSIETVKLDGQEVYDNSHNLFVTYRKLFESDHDLSDRELRPLRRGSFGKKADLAMAHKPELVLVQRDYVADIHVQ